MKKYLTYTLLLLTGVIYAAEPHDHVTVTQFCEQYHQRSYFVLRLEQIIALIRKHDPNPFTFRFKRAQFNNQTILTCIEEIEKIKSLHPFYELWKEARRYKYLDDQSFALDVTKLLFTIQHTIYTQTKHTTEADPFDIELHLNCSNYTEATTIRRYHVKRLSDMFALLKSVECSQRSLFEEKHEGCDCSFITHYDFSNRAIRACVSQMEEQKSLEPLLKLHQEFISFKLIQDEVFLREFTALTFVVARNIFINNIPNPPSTLQKRRKSHIAHIYENLDKIPIEEMLEAIDLLNKELPEILEKYEFNSSMSWKAWLKKYWWLPPTVGIVVALQLRWIFTHPLGPDGKRPQVPTNPLAGDGSENDNAADTGSA